VALVGQSAPVTEGARPKLLPIEAYSPLRARRSVGILLLLGTIALVASLPMIWHVTYPPDAPAIYFWGYQIPERVTLPLLIGGGTGLGVWTLLRPAGPGMKMLIAILLVFWFVLMLSELVSGYYVNGVVVLREGFWMGTASLLLVLSGAVVCYWPRL